MATENSESEGTITVTRSGNNKLLVQLRCKTDDGLRADSAFEVIEGEADYEYYLEKLAK